MSRINPVANGLPTDPLADHYALDECAGTYDNDQKDGGRSSFTRVASVTGRERHPSRTVRGSKREAQRAPTSRLPKAGVAAGMRRAWARVVAVPRSATHQSDSGCGEWRTLARWRALGTRRVRRHCVINLGWRGRTRQSRRSSTPSDAPRSRRYCRRSSNSLIASASAHRRDVAYASIFSTCTSTRSSTTQ